MIPATYNFNVVRGTSGPTQGLIFKLEASESGGPPVPIAYEDVRISIYDARGTKKIMRPALANGQIVIISGNFVWQPTTEDTRKIPKGENKCYYEVEVWNAGYEVVYMLGFISGIGGVNDDIDGFDPPDGDGGGVS